MIPSAVLGLVVARLIHTIAFGKPVAGTPRIACQVGQRCVLGCDDDGESWRIGERSLCLHCEFGKRPLGGWSEMGACWLGCEKARLKRAEAGLQVRHYALIEHWNGSSWAVVA
jgi:hypothetical protein